MGDYAMTWQTTTKGSDVDKGFNSDIAWNDIVLPADRLGQAASAPDRELIAGNIQALAFDGGGTMEQLFGSFEIVHDYVEGTDLRPHIHWSPSSTENNDVKWFLEYTIANRNDSLSVANTISVVTSTTGVDRKHIIVELPVIDGSTFGIGTTCNFRFYRNPSDTEDTYGGDAFLLSLGIHYESDGNGSRDVMAK